MVFLILTCLKIRLKEVTGMTSQSEVTKVIGATMCLWEDMFHLERKVKDDLWR